MLLILGAVAGLGGFRFWPHDPLPSDAQADRIVVAKADRELRLLNGDQVLRSYRIALGGAPRGAKERQGDERTPEGTYRIDWRNANSKFHLALHISYPNAEDRRHARELGVSPGGDIMIHGIANGYGWIGRLHRLVDWTNGCIALTDEEIEELWRAVPNGTPVDIRP